MADEFAWLIERRDYGTEYLSGEASGYFPTWTADPAEAIRFNRRVDAERIAGIFDDLDIHICEHQWPNLRTEPAPSTWPASVPPGESPNYPPPTIEDDVLTYAGFRWQRLPVPTVEPASSTEPPADLREQLFNVLVENTLHQPRQAIVDVLMPLINAAIARAAKPNQRLHDLVRHQRMELHAEELITDEEYAALAEDHAAVKRLEDYDEAIARAKADAVRPYERLIAIIRTSHDLGIYHEKDGRCEVCEILRVPRKLLEGR